MSAPVSAAAPVEKPAYGSPCNNCGGCCRAELCPLGEALFDRKDGPCPALEPTANGHICGLIANPERYRAARAKTKGRATLSQAALTLIGSGVGCDALSEGEKADPAERARFRAAMQGREREIRRAKIAWRLGRR